MKLILRACDESAKPFVADSFVRSYRGGLGPLCEVEAAARARALRTWLSQRWGDVRLMVGDEAPDMFLGWVLPDFEAEGWPAWYAYVKHEVRRNGLCREAFKMVGCTRVRLTNQLWQEKWNEKRVLGEAAGPGRRDRA